MRDSRINLIFEGSTEIMHLFLAREALDPHLKVAGTVLDSRQPLGKRAAAAMKAGGFYALWYPQLFLPSGGLPADLSPVCKPALAYVGRTCRRLARTLFHAMALNGPKLEKRQVLLARIVDIGTELFAISATALYADALIKQNGPGHSREDVINLMKTFTAQSQRRITLAYAGIGKNHDRGDYALAQTLLDPAHHAGLREGIVE